MFELDSARELHYAVKAMAEVEASRHWSPDTMAWRAAYSIAYTGYIQTYHQLFSFPSPTSLILFRREVGDTVMTVLNKTRAFYRHESPPLV